jgi:hypothetical protein
VRAPGTPTTATARGKTAPGIYRAQDAERVANRPEQPCFLRQGDRPMRGSVASPSSGSGRRVVF